MDRPTCKVLSLTDKGLLLDTFNDECQPVPCQLCVSHKEIVVYSTEASVTVYNSETTQSTTLPIANAKKILISPNTLHIAVLTKNQQIYLTNQQKVLFQESKVWDCDLSCHYLVYTQECPSDTALPKASTPTTNTATTSTTKATSNSPPSEAKAATNSTSAPANQAQNPTNAPQRVRIQKKEGISVPIKKSVPKALKALKLSDLSKVSTGIMAPLSFAVAKDYLLAAWAVGADSGEIEVISLVTSQSIKKITVRNFLTANFAVDTKYPNGRALCTCTLQGKSTTYYDTKVLYYIYPAKEVYKVVPIEGPIMDTAFLKKGTFAVCYKNSPSHLTVFNSQADKIKEFKKGIRNKLFFNRQENIVCLAGMNNLPGNIEIIETATGAFISANEVVGCSIIEWSPSGRFYLVAVTNRMAVDNKAILFDYYSRQIAERDFQELKDCRILGRDKPFQTIQSPPEKIKIEKKVAYVPPSLRTADQEPTCEWVPAYIIKNKEKLREAKIAQLTQELDEIKDIEARMAKGQVVPGGISKIQRKESLLKQLAPFKKS
ncbi:translation initiation factor 2A [Nematocida homosporus]|uniref:translation initiation factor 2A n=1 Tax=Nematocida homosporus TaxID=1912981 RepID=UPI002220A365|nr:translation initiation factor 2A [Nematocida homosporus]KAI5185272.1 translation initiation factor 2A [Nematocida homosporus]